MKRKSAVFVDFGCGVCSTKIEMKERKKRNSVSSSSRSRGSSSPSRSRSYSRSGSSSASSSRSRSRSSNSNPSYRRKRKRSRSVSSASTASSVSSSSSISESSRGRDESRRQYNDSRRQRSRSPSIGYSNGYRGRNYNPRGRGRGRGGGRERSGRGGRSRSRSYSSSSYSSSISSTSSQKNTTSAEKTEKKSTNPSSSSTTTTTTTVPVPVSTSTTTTTTTTTSTKPTTDSQKKSLSTPKIDSKTDSKEESKKETKKETKKESKKEQKKELKIIKIESIPKIPTTTSITTTSTTTTSTTSSSLPENSTNQAIIKKSDSSNSIDNSNNNSNSSNNQTIKPNNKFPPNSLTYEEELNLLQAVTQSRLDGNFEHPYQGYFPPFPHPPPVLNVSDPNLKLSSMELRELFVGYLPTGVNEVSILNFLNLAMRESNLAVDKYANAAVHARISNQLPTSRFAFVEFRTIQDAANALNLNNIPFQGVILKVKRPTKYSGPAFPWKNWQNFVVEQSRQIYSNLILPKYPNYAPTPGAFPSTTPLVNPLANSSSNPLPNSIPPPSTLGASSNLTSNSPPISNHPTIDHPLPPTSTTSTSPSSTSFSSNTNSAPLPPLPPPPPPPFSSQPPPPPPPSQIQHTTSPQPPPPPSSSPSPPHPSIPAIESSPPAPIPAPVLAVAPLPPHDVSDPQPPPPPPLPPSPPLPSVPPLVETTSTNVNVNMNMNGSVSNHHSKNNTESITQPQQEPQQQLQQNNLHQETNFREIYIGGLSSNVTESMLTEFLNSALENLCLKPPSTNSIVKCQIKSRFALVEFQTIEDATNCLNFNDIPLMGYPMRISRPLSFIGPSINFFSWKDLAKQWIDGELKVKLSGSPSPILEFSNIILLSDVENPVITEEVLWDLNEECQQCGDISSIKLETSTGKFYVQMDSIESSTKVLLSLKGRTYDSRVVDVNYFSANKYLAACLPDQNTITLPPTTTIPSTPVLALSGRITVEEVMGVHFQQGKV